MYKFKSPFSADVSGRSAGRTFFELKHVVVLSNMDSAIVRDYSINNK